MKVQAIVYRCYDADGCLLYVGGTMGTDARARLTQHRYANRTRGKSAWVSRLDHVEVDRYESWQEACLAEAALILALKPAANIQRPSVESVRYSIRRSLTEDGLDWLAS